MTINKSKEPFTLMTIVDAMDDHDKRNVGASVGIHHDAVTTPGRSPFAYVLEDSQLGMWLATMDFSTVMQINYNPYNGEKAKRGIGRLISEDF